MIPNHVYLYWHGSHISWLRALTIVSLRKFNPDLNITLLWNPKPPKQKLKDRNDNKNTKNFFDLLQYYCTIEEVELPTQTPIAAAQACDYFQWKILYERGGYFSDMDIIYVRPLNDLLNLNKEYLISYLRHFSIGFWGAKPKSNLMHDLVNNAEKNYDDYQCWGTNNICDVIYKHFNEQERRVYSKRPKVFNFFDMLKKYYPGEYYNIPHSYFYRWNYNNLKEVYGMNVHLTEEQIGIHWYGGHVSSKYWIENLNPDTLRKYNNTLRHAIERVFK